MEVKAFFDEPTYTVTYVVLDAETKHAVIIDPVWNYEILGSILTTESCEQVIGFVKDRSLQVQAIMETHAHADHISGAQILKKTFSEAPVVIGESITTVQKTFKDLFNLGDEVKTDGSQFDRLLKDGEVFEAGSLAIKTLHTPGHTPACLSYLIGDCVFTGDALFMPDYGTGRCDFPGGSAGQLYESIIQKLYTLSDNTRVFVGHDYQPGGRPLKYESTIGEQKTSNKQLTAKTSRDEFVKFRSERDSSLKAPKLLYQSIQINIQAGHLPTAESNGRRYLKIPLDVTG